MPRLYAQFAAVVFLAMGLGGLFTGDAGTLVHHHPGGNFGPVALHLTYTRDIVDLILGGAFAFAGFRAGDRLATEIVLTAGVLLLLLAVIGFAHPDNAAATRDIAGLHMTTPMNILDAVTGALACLCALGEPVGVVPRVSSAPAEKR
jgi:hypothetical protein